METCLKFFCKKSLKKLHRKGDTHPILALAHTDTIISEVREMIKGEMLTDCDIMLSTDCRTYEDCTIYQTGLILNNQLRVLVFVEDAMPTVVQVTVRELFDNHCVHALCTSLPRRLRAAPSERLPIATEEFSRCSPLSITKRNKMEVNGNGMDLEKGMPDIPEVENEDQNVDTLEKKPEDKEENGIENAAFLDDRGNVNVHCEVKSVIATINEISPKRFVSFSNGPLPVLAKPTEDLEAIQPCSSPDDIPSRAENVQPDVIQPAIPPKRIVSFKCGQSIRVEVPAGPIETLEAVPPMEQPGLDEIAPADAAKEPGDVAEPLPRVKVTYCPQQKVKKTFFRKNKLQIDLAEKPIELPEEIEINRQGCCSKLASLCNVSRRRKYPLCACVILSVIIALIIVFVPEKPQKVKH